MKIILASQSPRRQQLLEQVGLSFEVRTKNVSEEFPADIAPEYVPIYLAQKKAMAFENELLEDELLIAADTVVIVENSVFGRGSSILNKPADFTEAKQMLRALSNKMHTVITGVCLYHNKKIYSFSEKTLVFFKKLMEQDIDFYVRTYKPLDKAGGYGIQEFIGMIGIERIKGCFYNIMGLPVARLYEELRKNNLLPPEKM